MEAGHEAGCLNAVVTAEVPYRLRAELMKKLATTEHMKTRLFTF